MQYTSGSTGDPKGVILSHDNLLANIRAMGEALEVTSQDIFVSWLPLYHDMGLIGAWFGSMYYSVHLVIMSPLEFIARPERWLWAIHRYRGTLTSAPNFAFELCLKRVNDKELKGLDLSSLRKIMNGAEAVSPQTVENFTGKFVGFGMPKNAVFPVYGLAECSVGLAFPPLDREPLIDCVQRQTLMKKGIALETSADDKDPLRFVACGRPIPGHQIRVVDSADKELPERHEGYIHFKGPSSTSGYMRYPEKTKELFHGQWLDTGDMGYISGGDIFITGRKKDIVIRAGEHIYPEELEEEIGKVEGIRKGRVAVFGSYDPDIGSERLVVLAETHETDAAEKERMRREINIVVSARAGEPPDDTLIAPPDTVLKTSSGKIRRSASRALYETGAIGKSKWAIWRQLLRFKAAALFSPLSQTVYIITSFLYAAYVWLLTIVVAVPMWFIIMLTPIESWRWKLSAWSVDIVRRGVGIGFSVIGHENLPSAGKNCVFVSNHQSYLDAFTITLALRQKLGFIAKAELRGSFFARHLLDKLGTAFVERFDAVKGIEDFQLAAGRSTTGRPLVFFAEGTFSRIPGLRPFKLGAFKIAADTRLPIVPIAIRGTRSILRDVEWFPRRGNITVIIGEPIYVPEGESFKVAVDLRDQTREWILQHCGEPDLK